MALQICRTSAVLRPLDNYTVTNAMAALWRRLFARVAQGDRESGGPFGYLFVVARKHR